MNAYFFKMTNEERNNILDQHKEVYDGYVTQYAQPGQQPLYVQDLANDKEGITVNARGEVKKYGHMGINEQKRMEDTFEDKKICDECGLYEDVCECGKGYSEMDEDLYQETEKFPKHQSFDYIEEEDVEEDMDEGIFDFFDDDYKTIHDYFKKNNDEDEISDEGEFDTAHKRIKRGHEPEDIDWEDIDDDIKESFLEQKRQINEMFKKFKNYN